jgi:L-cysteine:1D-myo-inositol 2-amino-2-deoxy-alpha-D-glucopyranoside ligase
MRSWPTVYIPALPQRFAIPQLSLFNSADRALIPVPQQDTYRIYVCGITPYDATHLGHAATYLIFDVIIRYLKASGAEVKFVQNITDIDDPLLERAVRDGVDWQELANSQIDLFRGDMSDLHVIPPNHYIGVVEAMPLVIDAVTKLDNKKSTYLVQGDKYFRVHSDPQFGERSHLDEVTALKTFAERGGDPQREGKENPLDALVWLTSKPEQPTWPSSFGNGRPGWHIECSAIALHYLEPDSKSEFSLDIQGGGSDLIFPHHEMSAAQSAVMTGQPFARHYVHAGMIGLNGEKMSKSLGNLVFVSQLISEGISPMAVRWALLNRSYRQDAMWSDSILAQSILSIERLQLNLAKMEVAPTDVVITEIIKALSEDIDTERALRVVENWMDDTESGQSGGNAGELSRALDTLLGIAL